MKRRKIHDKKNPNRKTIGIKIKSGDYLLSHTPAHAVPSAYKGLSRKLSGSEWEEVEVEQKKIRKIGQRISKDKV